MLTVNIEQEPIICKQYLPLIELRLSLLQEIFKEL